MKSRKGPSHDFRPKIRGKRVDIPAASSTRRARRNCRKSPSIGDTITLNPPDTIGLSPGTDYGADSYEIACSPMEIDYTPPEMTCSDSKVPGKNTARQPSETPDLTQQKRETSEDNGGEEHTHHGGGEHEATATHPATDNIVHGAVHDGGAASPPAQGSEPAKPPGPPTTHTNAADPDNGHDEESWRSWVRGEFADLRRLRSGDVARADKHEESLVELQSLPKAIIGIHSALEALADGMKTLLQEKSAVRTPGDFPLPATPTSLSSLSPAPFEAGPSNGAGPADSRSGPRILRSHVTSDVRGPSGSTHSTRSGRNRGAAPPAR